MERFVLLTSFALFMTGLGTLANAAPNKPVNAADVDHGTGCLVRGSATQAYVYDAGCEFNSVTKAGKEGTRVFYRYQDKGSLQSGQTAPEKALSLDISMTIAGQSCSGKEVITPSGNYSSNLTCK